MKMMMKPISAALRLCAVRGPMSECQRHIVTRLAKMRTIEVHSNKLLSTASASKSQRGASLIAIYLLMLKGKTMLDSRRKKGFVGNERSRGKIRGGYASAKILASKESSSQKNLL